MNKSLITGLVAGTAVATAGAVVAGFELSGNGSQEPAQPVTQARSANDNCNGAQANAPKDKKRIAGTVIGGLVGGAVGNDVGHKKITTAAGAAVGAIAGNKAQQKFQEDKQKKSDAAPCGSQ